MGAGPYAPGGGGALVVEAVEEDAGRVEGDGVLVAAAVVHEGEVDARAPLGEERVGGDIRVEEGVEQGQGPAAGAQDLRVGERGHQGVDGHGPHSTGGHCQWGLAGWPH